MAHCLPAWRRLGFLPAKNCVLAHTWLLHPIVPARAFCLGTATYAHIRHTKLDNFAFCTAPHRNGGALPPFRARWACFASLLPLIRPIPRQLYSGPHCRQPLFKHRKGAILPACLQAPCAAAQSSKATSAVVQHVLAFEAELNFWVTRLMGASRRAYPCLYSRVL